MAGRLQKSFNCWRLWTPGDENKPGTESKAARHLTDTCKSQSINTQTNKQIDKQTTFFLLTWGLEDLGVNGVVSLSYGGGRGEGRELQRRGRTLFYFDIFLSSLKVL